MQDTHEQVEQTLVELNTFKELQALERVAIRSRVEVSLYVILEGLLPFFNYYMYVHIKGVFREAEGA